MQLRSDSLRSTKISPLRVCFTSTAVFPHLDKIASCDRLRGGERQASETAEGTLGIKRTMRGSANARRWVQIPSPSTEQRPNDATSLNLLFEICAFRLITGLVQSLNKEMKCYLNKEMKCYLSSIVMQL